MVDAARENPETIKNTRSPKKHQSYLDCSSFHFPEALNPDETSSELPKRNHGGGLIK
jgi:hypothetical protein